MTGPDATLGAALAGMAAGVASIIAVYLADIWQALALGLALAAVAAAVAAWLGHRLERDRRAHDELVLDHAETVQDAAVRVVAELAAKAVARGGALVALGWAAADLEPDDLEARRALLAESRRYRIRPMSPGGDA